MEVKKIKCPCCGAILSIKPVPGIEGKNVKCPVCNSNSPYKLYKNVDVQQRTQSEHTEYPGFSKEKQSVKEETEFRTNTLNYTFGEIKVLNSNVASFRLKTGKYIIGRKANSSIADFQIPTDGNNRMSKEHIVIEVKKVPQKGIVHYISLYKEKVNDTFLNNDKMSYGEIVILKNGDIIKLPDASLRFEINDEEGTEI